MAKRFRGFLERHSTSTAAGGLVALAAAVLLWKSRRPSNERGWIEEASTLPTAEFQGDSVTVRNVRVFSWSKEGASEKRYEDRSYDLKSLVSLDFILSRFGKMKRLAGHTLLSFGFADGRYLAVSVEIRRARGQHYSFLRGLFRHYELMYVIADERDVVRLRTNVRGEKTYLFPIKAPADKLRKLLVSILKRADGLAREPEFYNSIGNACTTNLIGHFNEVGLCKARKSGPRAVFSGMADGLLLDLGLIDGGTELEDLRKKNLITEIARAYGDGPEFSKAIRTR
jgi:hypothetical protein